MKSEQESCDAKGEVDQVGKAGEQECVDCKMKINVSCQNSKGRPQVLGHSKANSKGSRGKDPKLFVSCRTAI